MNNLAVDLTTWAEEHFGGCDLGDKRLTKRLGQVAAAVAANPSGSFPEQMDGWGDLKAAYRLFDSEAVTFDAVATPHWERTRAQKAGQYLDPQRYHGNGFRDHAEDPEVGTNRKRRRLWFPFALGSDGIGQD